jgi:hypothetical protein
MVVLRPRFMATLRSRRTLSGVWKAWAPVGTVSAT